MAIDYQARSMGAKNQKQITTQGSQLDAIATQTADVENKTGYVTYRQFGAILDGTADDSAEVLATHAYANANGLQVKEFGGKLLCNFTVDVYTSCYLDLDFILTDDSPYTCYRLYHDDITVPSVGNLTFLQNDVAVTNSDLYGKFFVPRLDDAISYLGIRYGAETGTTYYHRQPLATDMNGRFISSPRYIDHNGTFSLEHFSDISEKGIAFEGGRIITRQTSTNFSQFIYCNRNNCTIRDFEIVQEQTALGTTITYAYALFRIEGCMNCLVENISGINHANDTTTAHSYVIQASDSFNVKLNNINITQGWGCMATHFVDTFILTNSVVNRYDNHYGLFGLYNAENVILTGVASVNLGYGNGTVNLTNCTFNYTYADVQASSYIATRVDFRITFSGNLNVTNPTFIGNKPTNVISYNVDTLNDANESLSVGSFLPKIFNINDLSIYPMVNSSAETIPLNIYNSTCRVFSDGTINVIMHNCDIYQFNFKAGLARFHNCRIITVSSNNFVGSAELYNCIITTAINKTGGTMRLFNCYIYDLVNSSTCNTYNCGIKTGTTLDANVAQIGSYTIA